MKTFKIRVVFHVPFWGYAEVEAGSLDEALDIAEGDPEVFSIDFNEQDATPGDPEIDDVFFETQDKDGKWIPV